MTKLPVKLNSMQDAKYLVQIAESCPYDVELICGRYIVDAKSMLGVFSLPRFDQIEINVDETDFEHMKQKLQKYDLIQK